MCLHAHQCTPRGMRGDEVSTLQASPAAPLIANTQDLVSSNQEICRHPSSAPVYVTIVHQQEPTDLYRDTHGDKQHADIHVSGIRWKRAYLPVYVHTDRQTDRQTGRQADRQTHGATDGGREGRTDKQADKHTHTNTRRTRQTLIHKHITLASLMP